MFSSLTAPPQGILNITWYPLKSMGCPSNGRKWQALEKRSMQLLFPPTNNGGPE